MWSHNGQDIGYKSYEMTRGLFEFQNNSVSDVFFDFFLFFEDSALIHNSESVFQKTLSHGIFWTETKIRKMPIFCALSFQFLSRPASRGL